MKFFIDSANVDEIQDAVDLGMADGVTTNPTLLAKETGSFEDLYKAICDTVHGPVCAEAVSLDSDGIIEEGRELAKISDQIVVKIPATPEGLKAVKQLEYEGIRTNVTLIFSPMQALMAAKVNASFVCPFVGRLDDTSQDGMELIEQIMQIYHNYDLDTQVMVASIRGTLHVRDAALIGADIATIPFKVIQKLMHHPLTDRGVEQFLADWDKVKNR
jgi:transaldolase